MISVGTIGGGCVEGDVLLHASRLYDSCKAEVLTFHLTEDDIEHGLICGGSLDVLIEPLTKNSIPLFEEMRSLRDEGEDCILATFIHFNGTIGWKHILETPSPRQPKKTESVISIERLFSIVSGLPENLNVVIEKVHHRNETQRINTPDGELILEPVTGRPSLIIFGGGHVSKYISRAAAMVGFRVTIVDDREKFANRQRFPEAAETLAIDFADAFPKLSIRHSTYIVIVTRGHRYDEKILEQVVKTPARYIGMIGSKRKVLTTFERLIKRGVPVESCERVYAPMGIDIGAVTAEEIGISVVAQLIKTRRGEDLPLRHKSNGISELICKFQK